MKDEEAQDNSDYAAWLKQATQIHAAADEREILSDELNGRAGTFDRWDHTNIP
jgi:hypothetical protein